MKISSINQPYNLNFKATKIANTRFFVKSGEIVNDIYRLDPKDRPFIESLGREIDITNCCKQMTTNLALRWQRVLNYCLDVAYSSSENVSYVAINNNRPCGIMTYLENSTFFLDGICAIPDKKGNKVPNIGKSLFYQLFLDAKKYDANGIKLEAITDGPVDVIEKYKQLGFKDDHIINKGYVQMSCNKHRINDQLKELPFEINYIESIAEKTDLRSFLN